MLLLLADQYKQQLWASSKIGRYTNDNNTVMTSLKELKEKLNQLQEFGERVMLEKRHVQVLLDDVTTTC